jgi:beta-lactamase superfamily II metal-dependent hydrolase
MKRMIFILGVLAFFASISCSEDSKKMPWDDDLYGETKPVPEAKVGEVLPKWTEGCLDIHFINSGRGECAFYILPDGTTLLVDAGETVDASSEAVPRKPNAETRPYVVDATYIKHFLPEGSSSIDWCAPSHFHIDHIGSLDAATETSSNGYKLSGLTALYGEVPFNRVLDMGYPNYREDSSIPELDGQLVDDWVKFVRWAVTNKGMKADRFRPGEEQITLLKKQYDKFRIFNIVANGYVWNLDASTGQGKIVNTEAGKGNPASCGFYLRYGKFDYIACGDLVSTPQNYLAYYYRDFIVRGGLDVFKANHHLSSNSWGSQMQVQEFSPRVIINQSFTNYQPDIALLTSIITGSGFTNHSYTWIKDIFSTNVHPDALAANADLYSNVAGYNGHVVVRVADGGKEYYVYMLDDTDFKYKVRSIHGPYSSK